MGPRVVDGDPPSEAGNHKADDGAGFYVGRQSEEDGSRPRIMPVVGGCESQSVSRLCEPTVLTLPANVAVCGRKPHTVVTV